MFCSKCGYKMNDNDRFCPKCGNDCAPQQAVNPAPQPVQQAQVPVQTQPVQQAQAYVQPVQQNATVQPKEKSKKPLIAVIAIVIVVAIVVGIIFMLPSGSADKTEINPIFKNQYGAYYSNSISLISIDENDDFEGIMCENIDGDKFDLILSNIHFATESDTIYGNISQHQHLSKLTFTDKTTVKEEVWVDKDLLNDYEIDANSIVDYQICGDYVYCIGFFSGDNAGEWDYNLMRISKDGDDIKLFNISVASYIISGDWIYYFDTGYTYDEDYEFFYFNEDTQGVYKMKTDGSNKQMLLSTFKNGSEESQCFNFQIYKNNLYFLRPYNNKISIFRMGLDGSNPECVAKKALSYTIDSENNKLYYEKISDSKQENFTLYDICEIDLSTGEDKELCQVDEIHAFSLSIYNNCLYISPYTAFASFYYGDNYDEPHICGLRYNFKTEELEKLMGYCEEGDEPVIYLEDYFS